MTKIKKLLSWVEAKPLMAGSIAAFCCGQVVIGAVLAAAHKLMSEDEDES